VARALDDGGLVFEDNGSKTLAEALDALEEGLAERVRDHEAALRTSSPTAKKRRRRLDHDA